MFEGGAMGSGLMTVEHHVPRSADEGQEDAYDNCFYACRFCNGARSTRPVVDAEGRRLLHPCMTPWVARFQVADDRLRPVERDRDATYTHEAYDLDDERKVARRRARRESLDEALEVLLEGPSLIERLLDRARTAGGSASDLHEAIGLIRARIRQARAQVARFPAVPADAPSRCACDGPRTLPRFA